VDAIIFDMDGVILDSEPVHQRIERDLFAQFGFPIGEEEHATFVGRTSREMFVRIAHDYPEEWARAGQTVGALVRLVRSRYVTILRAGGVPFVEGVRELIQLLARRGHQIAIASSAPHEQIDIARADPVLTAACTETVSGDDVDRGKPAPDIFRLAAERLAVDASSCVVIEDSANGIAAARAAGMRSIGFLNPNSGAQDLSAADIVVSEIARIADIVA
jgi:HAD superfamily hydrolase (TIGR01509 family)